MSRISRDAMARALIAAQAMDLQQKEQLADEVFRTQPNLLGSVVVLPRLGVALSKVDFAIEILFVCFQAMKESGLIWPLITEDDQDRQLQRFIAITRFGDDLNNRLRERSMQQYIADHPEKELLAYVMVETSKWTTRIVPEESDKYVMLAIWNLVNCIAFVALPRSKGKTRRGQAK
ncbi:hypothetical protein [Aromatoleum anaerobium]|uniref:Uncharacterized protein n=1 Tax=Aromatoleum anaerobium TaxID=182180 RepID=A0ABX1PQT3_9RHOO|nr:hypothetical protein [Aromatoleum anaerobium]MCK0505523.1 hypothetical protein [Aromatoleum anaerobium]